MLVCFQKQIISICSLSRISSISRWNASMHVQRIFGNNQLTIDKYNEASHRTNQSSYYEMCGRGQNV